MQQLERQVGGFGDTHVASVLVSLRHVPFEHEHDLVETKRFRSFLWHRKGGAQVGGWDIAAAVPFALVQYQMDIKMFGGDARHFV